jgi:hypothetical protein
VFALDIIIKDSVMNKRKFQVYQYSDNEPMEFIPEDKIEDDDYKGLKVNIKFFQLLSIRLSTGTTKVVGITSDSTTYESTEDDYKNLYELVEEGV